MSTLTETDIRRFIVENFLFGDTSHPLVGDTSLIENDLVDSTGILELVAFIETHFEITMTDDEIVPANLDSITRICAYIERKLNEAVPVAIVAIA